MNIKFLVSISFVALTQTAHADQPCQIEDAVELYTYQDQILDLPKTSATAEEMQKKMSKPLKCLVETYKASDDLLIKYVAGSCLQRLMGGPEIQGFKKDNRYKIVYNSLINQQIASGALLSKSEIADFASGKWDQYIKFCRGSVTESLCSDLLPTVDKIKDQNELLGATSMIILKNAYNHFKGPTKQKIARQIEQLYKETPNDSLVKRRVIEQIFQDTKRSAIPLRGS